ncbi:hypothetical protein THRCLA_07167 [Thraustotheca clavata]|uniref:Uncharacterized protein n=1 Tax=Thraustotheca clavata TaxID=74557 RepID=A0A1V9ZG42_9STRA|nr:hypothetical protein THRCLA_07167 [Thraustotheca clavata]
MITNIQSDHPNASISIGFAGYRDYANGDLRNESIEFTSNVDDVYEVITKLKARGRCGNFADVPGGLAEALNMKWEADAKVIILVCDAPCYGKLYHDDYNGKMNPATLLGLTIAAANGNQVILEMLLNDDADVNATDMDDSTPLLHAVQHGHEQVEHILLNRHPRVAKRNKEIHRQVTNLLDSSVAQAPTKLSSVGHTYLIENAKCNGIDVAFKSVPDRRNNDILLVEINTLTICNSPYLLTLLGVSGSNERPQMIAESCLTFDPALRPSAKKIVETLQDNWSPNIVKEASSSKGKQSYSMFYPRQLTSAGLNDFE